MTVASRWAVFCLCLLFTANVSALDLSATELRGKQIFLSGTSPTNSAISAFLGIDRTELPASAAPCSSCHGANGRGRPEGGVIPSDITWGELSKSYGHDHQYGRRHPAFDEASVGAAITRGVDPAGNLLDTAMPLYSMEPDDLDALVAYLKRVEADIDPGVGEKVVRLATLLPLSGMAASQGSAIHAVLTTFIQQVNAGGGVNGRLLELDVIPLGTTRQKTVANVRDALDRGGIFALVATFSPGIETEMARLLEQQQVPAVGPITHDPLETPERSRHTFYLYSGTNQVLGSLAQFVVSAPQEKSGRQILLGSDIEWLNRHAGSVAGRGETATVIAYTPADFQPARLAGQLHAFDDVYFFGKPDELADLLRSLAEVGQAPRLLLPAGVVTSSLLEAPAVFDGRIFVAYPTLPSDISDNGRKAYAELATYGSLQSDHLATQISALAAVTVLVEAMKRAGHDLSRERLIEELEGLYRYETGLMPPISFDLNRRIGALGAHIVLVDIAHGRFTPVADWTDFQKNR